MSQQRAETWLPQEAWEERLAIEYSLIEQNAPTFDIIQGDLTRYRGSIPGINLYEEGFFEFEITLPRSFPYDPPDVRCMTRIWHPNLDEKPPGRVCLSLLKEDWAPSLHVFSLIEGIRVLLACPNPDDYLNSAAAREMKSEPEAFKRKVKDFIMVFAKPV